MNSLKTIAEVLKATKIEHQLTDTALSKSLGVQRQTIFRALSGKENFGVTTLLAMADRLGLAVMLAPKEMVQELSGAVRRPSASVQTMATPLG